MALKEDMPLLGIILMISGVPLGGYVSNYIDIDIKLLCKFIGLFVGLFFGLILVYVTVPILGFVTFIGCILLGHYIGKYIENRRERKRQEEYERIRKANRREKAQSLVRKYPEATKYYFKIHWNIIKTEILDHDITDDKVDTLLGHEYSYENDELIHNAAYKAKIDAERKAQQRREEERREAIERAELAKKRAEEEECRTLPYTLLNCVSDWYTHTWNSSIKHKWFIDYYPYNRYQNIATSSMWADWKLVWNFKNDDRISITDHSIALQQVIKLTEDALKSTFGSKVNKLTLVCLTASNVENTKRRFEDFSRQICSHLGMSNGFEHIKIIKDAIPKHLGGDGKPQKQYDKEFFKSKYIILFDDVRTSGASLEEEKKRLESLGAKVIGAITIAQTKS